MKTFRYIVLGLCLLVASVASVQAAELRVEWTNPTQGINTTTNQLEPLTADSAITGYQLWLSNSSLDTLPATPTVELPAMSPLQTSYVYTTSYGATVYVRMKVCNKYGCSNPTGQVQGTIPWPPVIPGEPQNVTIKVQL